MGRVIHHLNHWGLNFSCALNKVQVMARNSDSLIALFAPVMIGWNSYFRIGFSTVA